MRDWAILTVLLCGALAGCTSDDPADSVAVIEPQIVRLTDGDWLGVNVPAGPDGGYVALLLDQTTPGSARSARDGGTTPFNLAFDVDFDDHALGTVAAWGALAFRLGPDGPCLASASVAGSMLDSWPTAATPVERHIGEYLHALELSGGQLYRYLPRTTGFYQDLGTSPCTRGDLLVVVGAVSAEPVIRMTFQTTRASAVDLHRAAVVPDSIDVARVIKPLASGSGFSMGLWERFVLGGALVYEYRTESVERQGLATAGGSLQGVVQRETVSFGDAAARGYLMAIAESLTVAGAFEIQASGQAMGVSADHEATHGPAFGAPCPAPDCPEMSPLHMVLEGYGTGGYEWRIDMLGAHLPYLTQASVTFFHLDMDFEELAGSSPPDRFEVG